MCRRRLFVPGLLLVCLGGLSLEVSASRGEEPSARKLLLIGIDGCRPDALRAARTPHLDALAEAGKLVEGTLILSPRYRRSNTVSGPGWSSILTGVWADKHGVHDNSFQGKQYDRFPHFFQRLKQHDPDCFTASLVTWAPIHEHIVAGADLSRVLEGAEKNDHAGADLLAAREAADILREAKTTAVFAYFGQVDETGHRKGFHPTVPEYVQAIERVDAHVGTLVDAVRARPRYAEEEWLFLVGTDHGGRGTDHGGGHDVPEILETFLIVSGPSVDRSAIAGPTYMVDLPVTALVHLGVAIDPRWQLDGRPLGVRPPAAGHPVPARE